MTRESSHTDESTADRDAMAEVSHTNPYTNESMGSLFEHGVTVVADGGERGGADVAADADADVETTTDADVEAEAADAPMREVSHEAPDGGHGNRMFERVGDVADVEDEG